MFDLSDHDYKAYAEKGAEIELHDIFSGEPLGVFIGVIGEDSEDWQEALDEASLIKPGQKKSRQEKVKDMAYSLSSATTHWRGMGCKGKEIEFSKDAAMAIYSQYQWIADQVFVAIKDRALFLVNASRH